MEIKPKKEYYLENAARLQASMLKLPVDVMVSSMESVTRTLHEIQIQSQADHLEEGEFSCRCVQTLSLALRRNA